MSYDYASPTLRLTTTSPPQSFTEPISLSEAKAFLNLPARSPTDQAEDDLINAFITAAREVAEVLQWRDLVVKQWDLTLDWFAGSAIELRAPLVSVDLAQYTNSAGATTTMVENTDYIVDTSKEPGVVQPPYGATWPSFTAKPSSAVLWRFTSGFSATDAWWSGVTGRMIKVGMLLLISHWFSGRLPYELGAVQEYPWAVRDLLSTGTLRRPG